MRFLNKDIPEEDNADVTFDKLEAMAGILIFALNTGDGGEEIEFAMDLISRMQLFENQTDETFMAMIDKLLKILREQGYEVLIKKSLDALPANLHATAFSLTADIYFYSCNGVINDEKKKWLALIQKLLQIPDDLALKIVEVLQLKYQG